jgi:hypothetical protein
MNPNGSEQDSRAPLAGLLCEAATGWLRCRGWDGTAAWVDGDGQRSPATGSWEFALNDAASSRLIRLGAPGDRPLSLAEHAVMQSYLRAAAWLRAAGSDQALPCGGEWILADRDEVVKRLHDLNNRLNSLISNASVLATAHPAGERLNAFSQQMTHDSERCAEQLVALSHALLDART